MLEICLMASVKKFEDLEIWKMSRLLCDTIYLFFQDKKFSRDYKLLNQINGSSGSIMDNIAEGFESGGNKEFIQFLSISKASCAEVRSQLFRALDRGYISEIQFYEAYGLSETIESKIYSFMKYLKNCELKGFKYR
jgi:four helix bundle protein